MDLTRLAADAGQLINRAVQYTEESLGQADKTELDPRLEELLARAEATKTWTDTIISQTEVLLQPNPGARLEDRLYGHLDWTAPPRPRANEALGDQMIQAGLEIGSNTPYGTALLRSGEAQKRLGETEKNFVQSTNIHFLTPLRSFTEEEYRAIQEERRMLVNKRLDLDVARNRLKKAHEADREARNLNANPLDDDYLSHVSYMFSFLRVKWLKIWAQEITQAEMELRICQSLFDRQSEITRRAVEGISNTHISHMRSLTDFVEAQACYFDQCNQHAQELQRQLASVPAVLCSNNWQSAAGNAPREPPTGNHAAAEPVGLNHITPAPVVVHQLAEFDQDSWTLDAPPGDKTGSSASRQPPAQTNKNYNNNNSFSSAAALGEAKASKWDQVSAPAGSNDQSGAAATSGAASEPSAASEVAEAAAGDTSATPDTGGGSSTSNGDSAEPQTTSGATDGVSGEEEQAASATESQAVDQ